jgi:hypothetical protein
MFDPTITEAVAVWKTIEFYRDLEIQRVIVEENALKIVHALR